MGRGRGKGRKFIDNNNNDDNGSGEEEKKIIPPVQKRRGRPQKPLKDDHIDDDEVAEKIIEDANSGLLTNKDKNRQTVESGKKRNKKENENDHTDVVKSSVMESAPTKSNGGNRRKGKPCRAAEACVECRAEGPPRSILINSIAFSLLNSLIPCSTEC